jgi:hypothetical protein
MLHTRSSLVTGFDVHAPMLYGCQPTVIGLALPKLLVCSACCTSLATIAELPKNKQPTALRDQIFGVQGQ